jgi:hypothetical protein
MIHLWTVGTVSRSLWYQIYNTELMRYTAPLCSHPPVPISPYSNSKRVSTCIHSISSELQLSWRTVLAYDSTSVFEAKKWNFRNTCQALFLKRTEGGNV